MVTPVVIRHFIVRDVLGRIWVRYHGALETGGREVWQCDHAHRTTRDAQRCADKKAAA